MILEQIIAGLIGLIIGILIMFLFGFWNAVVIPYMLVIIIRYFKNPNKLNIIFNDYLNIIKVGVIEEELQENN